MREELEARIIAATQGDTLESLVEATRAVGSPSGLAANVTYIHACQRGFQGSMGAWWWFLQPHLRPPPEPPEGSEAVTEPQIDDTDIEQWLEKE